MTTQRATQLMLEDGYEPDVADSIIKTGTAQKAAAHTSLTKAELVQLYDDHAIGAADLEAHLTALGYSQADAAAEVALADLKRQRSYINQAISHLRTAVLARHVTEGEASGQLDALGIPSTERDLLLSLWALELQSQVKTLTAAQILKANKDHVFHATDAVQRLMNMGYVQADAEVLVAIDGDASY